MAKLAFNNARIITPDQLILDSSLLVHDQQIRGIVGIDAVPDEYVPIDLHGRWLAPGFIDIHVHGAGGADTLDGTIAAIHTISDRHLNEGTTAIYPTAASATPQRIRSAIQAVKDAMELPELAGRVLGIHLEGPFLTLQHHGAHSREMLRNPAENEEEWQDYLAESVVKLITLAPELAGSETLVRAAVERGVRVAIGHSEADFNLVQQAKAWGVNQCSHLFNAMGGIHQREPGTAGAMLALDSFYAQFIADGIHLHPAVLKIIARCKGAEKGILISDAMRAAGMPDGEYTLSGLPVVRKGNAVRDANGNLAGSTLSLAEAVRNMVKTVGVGLQDAVRMATQTPAKAMGIESTKGSLSKSRDADLVVLSDDLEILQVWSCGRQVR